MNRQLLNRTCRVQDVIQNMAKSYRMLFQVLKISNLTLFLRLHGVDSRFGAVPHRPCEQGLFSVGGVSELDPKKTAWAPKSK